MTLLEKAHAPTPIATDYPFGRVRLNESGYPDAYAWSENALGASDWQGFKVVASKEEASIYTAYRAESLSRLLAIARLYKGAKVERVSFAEWVESEK